MTPTSEQREAIDRLRRDAYEREGYMYSQEAIARHRDDMRAAVQLCLLTYPADGQEPVTNNWVHEEWGFKDVLRMLWMEREIAGEQPILVRWHQEINSVQIGTSNGIRGPWTRDRFRALMCALGAERRL